MVNRTFNNVVKEIEIDTTPGSRGFLENTVNRPFNSVVKEIEIEDLSILLKLRSNHSRYTRLS
jgi:hypothetical protein